MKGNYIDLKSVKLSGSGLEAKYVQNGTELNMKCKAPVHPDLREVFKQLVPYFVDVCEFNESDGIDFNNLDDPKTVVDLKKYTVSGLTISGSENSLSIVFIGHKLLESVKTLYVNSPRVNISEGIPDIDENKAYHLRELCQDIVFEVEEYVINRKYAVQEQCLPFKDDDKSDPFEEGENG